MRCGGKCIGKRKSSSNDQTPVPTNLCQGQVRCAQSALYSLYFCGNHHDGNRTDSAAAGNSGSQFPCLAPIVFLHRSHVVMENLPMTKSLQHKVRRGVWDRAERLTDEQVHWRVQNLVAPCVSEPAWEQVTWRLLRLVQRGPQR